MNPEPMIGEEDVAQKTAINKRVQARYGALMHLGKHGHYETMFRIVHEERAAAISAHLEALKAAGWIVVRASPDSYPSEQQEDDGA